MHLKGGEKMTPHKIYLYCCLGIILIGLIIKLLLPFNYILGIFGFLFTINSLISLYVLYSLYEMNVLHEKQGSKLSLSKDKLNIKWD